MNPTVANIVEQARMGYLALRTGDYRDLRRAVDHLTAFPSVPFGIMARLANDLLDRKPYDGRNPLAEPVLRGFLEAALNAEGYVVLPANWTDDGNSHYGPLCPRCEARYKYQARRVGKVPDPSWVGAVCVDCCRTVDGATREVTIHVW